MAYFHLFYFIINSVVYVLILSWFRELYNLFF